MKLFSFLILKIIKKIKAKGFLFPKCSKINKNYIFLTKSIIDYWLLLLLLIIHININVLINLSMVHLTYYLNMSSLTSCFYYSSYN